MFRSYPLQRSSFNDGYLSERIKFDHIPKRPQKPIHFTVNTGYLAIKMLYPSFQYDNIIK